ncbi:MAG: hypothetical protein LBR80_17225 [Deltaproteobacteria bacterium]|nr:hypothetical protein [Deltaproteobacteria bacterium]
MRAAGQSRPLSADPGEVPEPRSEIPIEPATGKPIRHLAASGLGEEVKTL